MITGIGTDIIDIRRIEKLVDKYPNFLCKYFTENEINLAKLRAGKKYYARIALAFSAKEAAAKAFGTGIRGEIKMRDIEILRDEMGKPIVILHNKTKEIIGNVRIHLALSDEYPYAISYIVIEK